MLPFKPARPLTSLDTPVDVHHHQQQQEMAAPVTTKQEDEVDDDGLDGKEKKRKRVERACFGCRQRRSKCDGQTPCHNCQYSGTECLYPPPPRRVSMKYVEELERKVAELEQASSSGTALATLGTHDGTGSSSNSSKPSASEITPIPSYSVSSKSQSSSSSSHQTTHHSSSSDKGKGPASHIDFPSFGGGTKLPPINLPPLHQFASVNSSNTVHDAYGVPSTSSRFGSLGGNGTRPTIPLYSQPSASVAQQMLPPPHPLTQGYQSPSYPYPTPIPHHQSEQFSSAIPSPSSFAGSRPGVLFERSQMGKISPAVSDNETASTTSPSVEERDEPGYRHGSGSGRNWERSGQSGFMTNFVEKAALAASGGIAQAPSKRHQLHAGRAEDDFLTQTVAPIPIDKIAYHLPTLDEANEIMSFYHHRAHPLFPILHWSSFVAQYETTWNSVQSQSELLGSDHIFLATANLVLATACAMRSTSGDIGLGATFFKRSQALLSIPHIMLMGNRPIIQYLLLLCQYSQSCSKGNLAPNAVGLAIHMARGLQINNPTVNGTFPPIEQALRQRVWAGCQIMEATSSAMLYRQTMSTDADYEDSILPSELDDDELTDSGYKPRQSQNAPRSITFFIFTTKLFGIKCAILRAIYDFAHPKAFPDAETVLKLDEKLETWWRSVPDWLRETEKIPQETSFRRQAALLKCRYINTRLLCFRPFLFHFCTTPGGTNPIPSSMKFYLARRSADVCAELAIDLIEATINDWKGLFLGAWWYSLAYVYSGSLVILANKIVQGEHPSGGSPDLVEAGNQALQSAQTMMRELGWDQDGKGFLSEKGVATFPTAGVRRTARRCFRIIFKIAEAVNAAQERRNRNSSGELSNTSAVETPASTQSVPPSRYARNPDPHQQPLRIQNPDPFDDDQFISSWISIMQPSGGEEGKGALPQNGNSEFQPYDLRSINYGGFDPSSYTTENFDATSGQYFSGKIDSPQQQQPPSQQQQQQQHQQQASVASWPSLLGSGYLSNLGPGGQEREGDYMDLGLDPSYFSGIAGVKDDGGSGGVGFEWQK